MYCHWRPFRHSSPGVAAALPCCPSRAPPPPCHPQLEMLKMDPTFLNRNVNEGFSGGEKKRNEILQLAVLEVGAWGGLSAGALFWCQG